MKNGLFPAEDTREFTNCWLRNGFFSLSSELTLLNFSVRSSLQALLSKKINLLEVGLGLNDPNVAPLCECMFLSAMKCLALWSSCKIDGLLCYHQKQQDKNEKRNEETDNLSETYFVTHLFLFLSEFFHFISQFLK